MESSIECVNEENIPALISTPNTCTTDNNVFTKISTNILEFVRKTGYTLVQNNGQRRYGGPPPKWEGPPPPKGCEVFVGKIPRDCFEDELVPVFEEVGEIYELRLMMDFSGSNRGYGFVTYSSPEIAARAVKKLNNYEIRLGMRIGVVKSVNNCRLFIGGIPSGESESDVRRALCLVTEGVVEVRLIKKTGYGGKNRPANWSVQDAIVEYDSHRSAALARRHLIPNRKELWGKDTIVDWAKPESCRKPHEQDFSEDDSGMVTLPSRSSSHWSLERAMDIALYGNFCTDSTPPYVTKHAKNSVQLLEKTVPNINNLSPDSHAINSAPKSNTPESFSAVGVNGAVGQPGTEFVSRLENGRNISGMRYYGIQVGNSPGIFELCQGNYCNGDSFGPAKNFDPILGLQKMQMIDYSGGDCRPPQVYFNGATHTHIFSDYMRSNEGTENMPTSLHDRAPLTKLSCDQTPGKFNMLKGVRAIRGSWSQEDSPSHRFSPAPGGPVYTDTGFNIFSQQGKY